MIPDDHGSDADLDSAVPANGPRIGASIRASSGTPMLSPGALAVWGLPLRPPLPRAALNRGGAAREDLRACRSRRRRWRTAPALTRAQPWTTDKNTPLGRSIIVTKELITYVDS